MEKTQIKVLLVEDNPVDVILLRQSLEKDALASFELKEAVRLNSALDLLQKESFDVILLDLGLPDSQGLDTFIRIHQTAPETPTVILSGFVDEDLALQSVQLGAQDYLIKSYDVFSSTARAIRYAMERHQLSEILRESEERFSSAFEYAAIGMALVDPTGTFLKVNYSLCELLGYSESELLYKTFQEITHPDDLAKDLDNIRRVLAGEIRTYQMEKRYYHRSRQIVWVMLSVSLVRDKQNNPLYFVSQIENITERKRAEEALKESLARFQTLFESSPEAIMLIDPHAGWPILGCNVTACEMNGYTREDMVGQSIDILNLTPGNEAERQKYLDEIQRAGVLRLESLHRRKDRSIFPIEVSTSMITLGGRQVVLGIDRDITERKQAEEQIRAAQAFAQDTIDALSAHICVLDENGVIVSVNRAWCEFADANPPVPTGYFLGDNYLTVCDNAHGPGSEEAAMAAQGIRAVMSGEVGHFQLEYPCPSTQEKRWFTLKLTRFVQNGSARIVVAHENITERKQVEEALKESEERYRSIFDGVQDAILVETKDGRILGVNKRACEMYGYMRDEFLEKTVRDLVLNKSDILYPPDTQPNISSTSFETINCRANGDLFQVEISGGLQTINGEEAFLVIVRDITERKRAEEALRHSHEQLTLALKSAGAGLWSWDMSTEKLDWSPELFHLFGLDPEKSTATFDVWQSVLHPQDRQTAEDKINEAIRQRIPLSNEYRVVLQSGEERWIEALGDTTYDEEGTPRRMMGVCIDITERMQAAERLRQSEEQYRYLFENNPHPMWAYDLKTLKFLAVNDSAVEKYGYSRAEFLEMTIADIRPADEVERLKQNIARPRPPLQHSGEWRHRLKNGTIIDVDISSHTLNLGGHDAALVVALDITERKQAEENLRESEAVYRRAMEAAGIVPYYESYEDNGSRINYDFIGAGIRQITGYRPEEFNSQVWDSLVEEAHLVEELAGYSLDEGIQKVQAGEIPIWKCEHLLRARDGSIHWVFEAAVDLFDAEGNLRGSIGSYQDITARKQAEESLRKNERVLRLFVEHSPAAIAMFDREMRYIIASRRFLEDYGLSEQNLIGRSHYEVFPEISERIKEVHRRCLQGAIEKADEDAFPRANGSLDWVRWEVRPWYEREGNIGGIILFSEVITERKQFENQLRESNQRFTEIANNIPDIFWVSEPRTWKSLYISPAFQSIVGQSIETVSQLPNGTLDVLLPEDRHILVEARRQEDIGMKADVQYRICRPDGGIRWIRDRGTPVFNENGRVVRVVGIARDMTEQVEAEINLRESELRLRQMAENIQEAFWMFDRVSNKHVYANHAYEVTFEVTEETQRNTPDIFTKRVVPEDLPAVHSALEKQKLGESTEIEYRIRHANGTIRWVWDRSFPVHDEDGRLTRTAGVATDITERKLADEEMRQRMVELEMLYASGLILNQLSSPKKIGEKIIELLEQKMDWHHSVIRLCHPADQSLKLLALNQPSLNNEQERQEMVNLIDKKILKLGEGLSGWAVENNQIVRSGNISEDPRYHETYPGMRSGLYVPMALGGNVIGVISIESEKPDAFSESDERLVVTLSNQAVIAIENALLNSDLEQRVKERTAEVEDLYNNAPIGYHSLSADGAFVMVNQTELNWLGYTREEVLGRPVSDFLSEQAVATFQQKFPVFKERGWQKDVELDFIRKDGSILPALVSATLVRDGNGEYLMSRSAVFDNSERKKAEDALRASEKRLNFLLANTPAIIFTTRIAEDMPITFISNSVRDVLGYEPRQYLEDAGFWLSLVHQDDLSQSIMSLQSLMVQGHAIWESRVKHANGSWLWTSTGMSLLRDEQGHPTEIIGYSVDINEMKQAEEALLASEAQLRQSRDELSSANAELERASRMKDEFLASMSHELRTPLTGILGLSEALQLKTYGELNEKQQMTLKTIEESGRHLLELINDILDLSKIEAGKLELQFAPCSIAEVCQASLQLTKGMAHKKRQVVHYSPSQEPIIVHADARRLKQILVNLLSNAVKFSPEEGELGLEVQADIAGRNIKMTVWDKGIGIKAENIQGLFDPFTQIDSGLAREYSGTGLGLSLVHRLVKLHNGGVEVESAFGEGSRFTVTLPWSPENNTPIPYAPQRAAGKGTGSLSYNRDLNSPKIFVVDDNEVVLQMVGDYLETKQYRVTRARGALELFEHINETRPDLIIMDIQMPGMNGLDAIRLIRSHADPAIAEIPIIAITALAMSGDRERCLEAGADEYMSKPVKLRELSATIKNLIGNEP